MNISEKQDRVQAGGKEVNYYFDLFPPRARMAIMGPAGGANRLLQAEQESPYAMMGTTSLNPFPWIFTISI